MLHGRKKRHGETTPLLGKAEFSIFSPHCFLVVGASLSLLLFLAYAIHRRSLERYIPQVQETQVRPGSLPFELNNAGAFEARVQTSRMFRALDNNGIVTMPDLEAEIHSKCNPMLPRADLSHFDFDKVLGASEDQCGQKEAGHLRDALDSLAYSYEASSPIDGSYPARMEEKFRKLNRSALARAIESHTNGLNAKLHNPELALLVQFFTWGWPVHSRDLQNAMGSEAVLALQACRLLVPCSKVPTHWVSALMLFPVPQTAAIVAVDWGQRRIEEMQEVVVPILDEASVGLMQNIPIVRGKTVLDLSGSGGAQAVVAVQRGARSVVALERNSRAARIARFNAWMNGASSRMQIWEKEQSVELDSNFNMCLGPNQAQLSPSYLEMCTRSLKPDGIFVFAINVESPKQTRDSLCTKLGLVGYEGTIVYKDTSTKASVSAADSGRFERLEDQKKGIVFGWGSSDLVKRNACGTFQGIPLAKPMGYSFGMSKDRACYWSNHGCPLS